MAALGGGLVVAPPAPREGGEMEQEVKTHLVLELVQECGGEVLDRQRVTEVVPCTSCSNRDGGRCRMMRLPTRPDGFCFWGIERS